MPPLTTALGIDSREVVARRADEVTRAIDHIRPTHVLWIPSSTLKSVIDSIADKGIFHKNKAARHKSRLSAKIKAMAA